MKITAIIIAMACGFFVGYQWPRGVEIESTKPVVLHYEITDQAAKLLVFKYAEDQGEKP